MNRGGSAGDVEFRLTTIERHHVAIGGHPDEQGAEFGKQPQGGQEQVHLGRMVCQVACCRVAVENVTGHRA